MFDKKYLECLARKHRFVQRSSRLNAFNFVNLLLFAGQHIEEFSLEDLGNDLNDQFGLTISKQGLNQRFNSKGVEFMKELLTLQLSRHVQAGDLSQIPTYKKRFNRIRIKDSTRFTLPEGFASAYKGHGGGGSSSQISIQYEYDILSGRTMDLSLTGACRNDQQDSKETLDTIQKGDLLMRDLAYAGQAYLRRVDQEGAYYLNRLNTSWTVFDAENKPIDFVKIHKKIKRYKLEVIEVEAFVQIGKKGKDGKLPTRLFASKVSQHVYKNRIRKAEKEARRRGYKVSDKFRAAAWMDLFITNIPREWLAPKEVQRTYGLRWQVELIFKMWKSQARINKVRHVKLERFECQLIGRFIWLLINWQAYRLAQEWMIKEKYPTQCSVWKFFKAAFRLSYQLRQVMLKKIHIHEWLKTLLNKPIKTYATETKNCRLSTYYKLELLLA
jgi:hypothetical protein